MRTTPIPEELVNVVPEFVEENAKKLEEIANETLDQVVARVPITASAVQAVDGALAGYSCSFGLFGWIFSLKRSRRSPATSEAPSNKVSN